MPAESEKEKRAWIDLLIEAASESRAAAMPLRHFVKFHEDGELRNIAASALERTPWFDADSTPTLPRKALAIALWKPTLIQVGLGALALVGLGIAFSLTPSRFKLLVILEVLVVGVTAYFIHEAYQGIVRRDVSIMGMGLISRILLFFGCPRRVTGLPAIVIGVVSALCSIIGLCFIIGSLVVLVLAA